ncbi:MAG: oxygen-independent coproporphyrinogen III oxidase [Bacteroidota bacterium]|nr:oxygen-independent coproporphyrinogen III oxidase [Bacteroidota bacterium]MDP4247308.1 oxygen-independent coproporphyrinogen III oxidase [Bacteroidota bacterium]
MEINPALLQKLNQPVPRYTSYPTVPFWKENLDIPRWKSSFRERFAECNASEGISLYLHLPFCESLCIYCGCNKKITTNHKVEEEYLQAILSEWKTYLELMDTPPVIRELHIGGGTPTFFSPDNLDRLISGILSGSVVHPEHAFSIEGHPNNTTREHLATLHRLGFRRISYGVQDLNKEVQQAIRRIQPFDNLRRATGEARELGFAAVNFDLIYGLPLQTLDRLQHTILGSISLRPDRLAFYSYAHTPWMNCSQRLINELDLPSATQKMELYEQGKRWLTENGYSNIGMDHFALPTDELYTAWQSNTLHRNFMGYTTQATGLMLGLGVSAISDTGLAFAQNDKTLEGYYRAVRVGGLAVTRGYFLTAEDLVFRRHILDIACKGSTIFDRAWSATLEEWTLPLLRELESDGLLVLREDGLTLSGTGRTLLRHVCKAFDLHLLRDERARGNASIRCGKSALAGAPPSPNPPSSSGPQFSNAI